jgi:hypothetical protein
MELTRSVHVPTLYRDVLQSVFVYGSLQDLYVCSHVCRNWRTGVAMLSPQRKSPIEVDASLMWRLCCSSITRHIARIDLCCTWKTDPFLLAGHEFDVLFGSLPHLTSIRCNVSIFERVHPLPPPCLRIQSLRIHVHVPASHTSGVQLNGWSWVTQWFVAIGSMMPHLDAFDVSIGTVFSFDPDAHVFHPLAAMSRLTHFGFSQWSTDSKPAYEKAYFTPPVVTILDITCPMLTSLSIHDGWMFPSEVHAWSGTCAASRLHVFDVRNTLLSTDADIAALSSFTSLRTIHLLFTDYKLFASLRSMSHLTSLTLHFLDEDTWDTVDIMHGLLQLHCPLRMLCLRADENVSLEFGNNDLMMLAKKWPELASFTYTRYLVDVSQEEIRTIMPRLTHLFLIV